MPSLPRMPSPATRFTTKELSKRTWPDFERLFSRGNGWDHCWCMAYQGGNKSGARRAERSEINRADKLRLLDEGRAHGVLVYAKGEPVGWCQFGPEDELPVKAGGDDAELRPGRAPRLWRITCFVTDKRWQHQGVARAALRAALDAIRASGGGVVEAYPFVHSGGVPADAEVADAFSELVRRYGRNSPEVKAKWYSRKGGVIYEAGKPLIVEELIDGVGAVNALCRWWGPALHTGTVAMFQQEGFKPVGTVEPASRARKLARTGADDLRRTWATRLVMQKTVRKSRARP